MYPTPDTFYPCKTPGLQGGPSLPLAPALPMGASHGCTFTPPAFQTHNTEDARKYTRLWLCSIIYANPRHTGGGPARTAADPVQLLGKVAWNHSSPSSTYCQNTKDRCAGHLERQEYNPQLTNCKELTPSLSPRIIICFGTTLRHFCLFSTGLCISLELERQESIPQLGNYSGAHCNTLLQPRWMAPAIPTPPPPPRAPTRTVQLPPSGTSTDAKLVSAAREVQTPVHFWVSVQQSSGFTS